MGTRWVALLSDVLYIFGTLFIAFLDVPDLPQQLLNLFVFASANSEMRTMVRGAPDLKSTQWDPIGECGHGDEGAAGSFLLKGKGHKMCVE